MSVCERQRERERQRETETERNRQRDRDRERQRQREGRWARENSVNSNSETLFYKDCNLGSVKTVGGGGERKGRAEGRRAGIAQWVQCRTRNQKVSGSKSGRSGGRIARVIFLC